MNDKNIFYAVIAVILIYLFSQSYYDGRRMDDIQQQLDGIKTNQHELAEQIKSAGKTNSEITSDIAGSREQVDGIAESNQSIGTDIGRAGAIIDECQQILARISARDEEKK